MIQPRGGELPGDTQKGRDTTKKRIAIEDHKEQDRQKGRDAMHRKESPLKSTRTRIARETSRPFRTGTCCITTTYRNHPHSPMCGKPHRGVVVVCDFAHLSFLRFFQALNANVYYHFPHDLVALSTWTARLRKPQGCQDIKNQWSCGTPKADIHQKSTLTHSNEKKVPRRPWSWSCCLFFY